MPSQPNHHQMQFNAIQLKADEEKGKLDPEVLEELGGLLHALENLVLWFNGLTLVCENLHVWEVIERVAKTAGVELQPYKKGEELAHYDFFL